MFKKIVSALFCGLIITTLFATYASAKTAEELGGEVLRLHILANSDSSQDQQLKLTVRDAVIAHAKELFADVSDKQQAMAYANAHLGQLETIARRTLQQQGFDYPITASVERTFFPTREYEDGTRLPAGFYDALRLEIGEGKGRNWWCILYPPLCLGGSVTLDEMATSRQGQIEVKFKLAEWWNHLVAIWKGVG